MAASLKCAALSGQDVIHLPFLFWLEEDVEEDRNNQQEAGHSHHSHNQPREGGVCGKRGSEVRVKCGYDFIFLVYDYIFCTMRPT